VNAKVLHFLEGSISGGLTAVGYWLGFLYYNAKGLPWFFSVVAMISWTALDCHQWSLQSTWLTMLSGNAALGSCFGVGTLVLGGHCVFGWWLGCCYDFRGVTRMLAKFMILVTEGLWFVEC